MLALSDAGSRKERKERPRDPTESSRQNGSLARSAEKPRPDGAVDATTIHQAMPSIWVVGVGNTQVLNP